MPPADIPMRQNHDEYIRLLRAGTSSQQSQPVLPLVERGNFMRGLETFSQQWLAFSRGLTPSCVIGSLWRKRPSLCSLPCSLRRTRLLLLNRSMFLPCLPSLQTGHQ